MDTYFKVLLEHQCADAAKTFNGAEDDTTEKEEALARLLELLELNYPEFKGRYKHIGNFGGELFFVAIDRTIPETATTEPSGEDMWQE